MGGFYLLRDDALADGAAAVARIAACAGRMGFSEPETFRHGGYLFCVYPKIGGGERAALRKYENGDFIFSSGTLIYKSRIGGEAVDALYRDGQDAKGPPDECHGHFALIVCRSGRVSVMGDSFGGYQIYYDVQQRVISSSFLMLAAALPSVSFSLQNIYEYVFNGVVSGDETLLREIVRLPIGAVVDLAADGFALRRKRHVAPSAFDQCSIEEHLERVDAAFAGYFDAVASVFGDNVLCALSGGYDSRLLVGLLRRHGVRPQLFVYGRREDPDVQLAEQIARGEGMPFDIIDKSGDLGAPDRFAETVERNYWSTDGRLWTGLFDNGAETAERARRVACGRVAINGGGGEILRNFFYFLDGQYSVRQLLWSFYSQFDPANCTGLFLAENYYRRLEGKLDELIEDVDRLTPAAVSWLYHRFRCRSWDGESDSSNNRYGHTLLPFQESRLTELGSRIPNAYKNHGMFEALLIARIDKRLAGYPSIYGHSFAGLPPLKRKMSDYASMLRPTFLRRLSFRLQHRLGLREEGSLPAEAYLEAVLPGRLGFADAFFRLEKTRDPVQANRILSLEYLARRLGPTLDPAVD